LSAVEGLTSVIGVLNSNVEARSPACGAFCSAFAGRNSAPRVRSPARGVLDPANALRFGHRDKPQLAAAARRP